MTQRGLDSSLSNSLAPSAVVAWSLGVGWFFIVDFLSKLLLAMIDRRVGDVVVGWDIVTCRDLAYS